MTMSRFGVLERPVAHVDDAARSQTLLEGSRAERAPETMLSTLS